MQTLRSTRPYLLRALYEWIVDNELTPQLLVVASEPGVVVPRQYVNGGKIVLNISPAAVRGLEIGNETVRFGGRFAGRPYDISLPVTAVEAIYARENGKGLVFPPETQGSSPSDPSPDDFSSPPPRRPNLKVVK
ncbi:MAG: ClpXP protease specificity-enhancing factor [Gammaproteobacteria bacterium]